MMRRRNPTAIEVPTGVDPRSPKVQRLVEAYRTFHWGAPPDRIIRINDPMVPDAAKLGDLYNLDIGPSMARAESIELPKTSILAYDKDHPRERLYVILPKQTREEIRNGMKGVPDSKLYWLQEIAESTGGDHADYELPELLAYPLGVLQAVVYYTYKRGEEGDKPWEYKHDFGHEHSDGIRPILAADVSGRLWICGGSYRVPAPGITG